jgi:hypothetical protein
MSNLIIHSGAERVTRDELMQVETPLPVDRWYPIPHAEVVHNVERALDTFGVHVVEEEHGMWKDGSRYFAVLQVQNGTPDAAGWNMVIGVRNSHDKSFAAGIALGSHVFVCDNLAFSGEVSFARKHTRYIRRDLPGIAMRALGKLFTMKEKQIERHEAYTNRLIDDRTAHDVVVRAVDARVIPNAKIAPVLKEWREPSFEEFQDRTLWSLFNAFTFALKGSAEFNLPARTRALYALCDRFGDVDQPEAIELPTGRALN